jgi:protein-S-isoprenylcysteine O-methyltransferase Ste14
MTVRSLKAGRVTIMDRFTAYSVIALAYLIGGGSLLLFGAFLVAGPFSIIRFDLPEAQALLWDAFLSMLFFIQHSGMIRQSFRARLSAVQPHYQPSTYAIASGAVLAAVVLLWQTSQTVLLEIQGPFELLLRAFSLLAIAGLVWVVRALRTFDPFGRQSITVRLRGKQHQPLQFALRGPYFWVRHPIYFFMLVLIWSTPDMTSDRLLFNVLWTSWIIYGSYLEEKDLVAEFGETYRQFQETVPMLLPWRGPVGRRLQRS